MSDRKTTHLFISPVDIMTSRDLIQSLTSKSGVWVGICFSGGGIPNFTKKSLQWKKQRNRGPECKSYQKACNGMDRSLNQIRGHQTDELHDLLERKGKSRVGCWVRSFHPRKIIAQEVSLWMSKNFTPISTDLLDLMAPIIPSIA